ncbi:hypothetical protein UFOVP252_62 [uncultured Caudovirales phage]|uniref:Bacteriophage P22, Gp10, DNA-stabilising n=1 Tax=uncultured Caudovirales phage TaxID=2100421 RepID=A0A6J5LG32_9CAUD|nr:hypothetical protein UFOVP252_62 [uncultured Caudovirales phage]
MTTERIPLTQPIESRTGSFAKDSYSSNCFFETRDQKREFIKRPGLVAVAQVVPITPPAYSDSQGLVGFNNKLIAVIDNTVYQINPSGYAVTTVGTTSTSTSQSYFVRTFLDAYLFFHNKVNGYLLSKAGAYSTILNDKISNISIDNPGLNYSSGVTLSFSSGGVAATATVVNGSITEVTITNAGSGLSAAPTCTVTAALTVSPTCTGTINTTTIVASDATGIYIGMAVYGTGIVSTGAKVTSISGTTITLDTPNIDDVSGTVFFIDQGSGAVLTPALNFFPSGPYVSGAVFLDNYVFIGTATNRIYNSALGDPTTWGALDYLTFEQTTDTLVGIAKHLNYLVAFGKVSTQFFYDVGNASGSPLGLAASYTSEIGCASGDSIVSTSNTVLWVGTSKTFGRSVYIMDGVSAIRVSNANIDRHLEADGLNNVTAYCYTVNGHTLYILTLHNTNQTLVYDLTEKMWYTWTQYSMQSNDQPNPGTYQESYFRPTFYAEINNVPYVLDDDTATLYYFDINTYQDNGQPIYCRTVTDIIDNGSTKRKFYGRLEIIGDKVAATMQIRHSGDDYNTWSSYRSVDLNASRSQIYLSGADRRRAWEFLVTGNVPLRLDAAEVDFRIGEMDQEQNVGGGRYRR